LCLNEYIGYYHSYISRVHDNDLVTALENGEKTLIDFLNTIPEPKLDYKYQEDKWSVKEVIIHMLDVERIFAYRALRFSRNDQTPLPGFDENDYIPYVEAPARSLSSLIEEYKALRKSTIELFKNMSADMGRRTGIANGKEISVRALGFIIPGHELHHIEIIKERYL
jgi:uncharacterized damage-inducible protein DinB